MRVRIGCGWFSMKRRSLVGMVWGFTLHKGIPWPAQRPTASQMLCPFEVSEWFPSLLHECATSHSAQVYVDSLRWDWLSHHRRATLLAMNEWFPAPSTELSTHSRSQQSTWCQLFWDNNFRQVYDGRKYRSVNTYTSLRSANEIGVKSVEYEAGESSETGNTGAYPPNYTASHSQVTPSYEHQITIWPEFEVTNFTAFSQMFTPRAVGINVECCS